MSEAIGKGKAIIVGGSIAGLCCAHALIEAGWNVLVLEKANSPPRANTGGGMGLDRVSLNIIEPWLKQPHLLHLLTLPLTIRHEQARDYGDKNISCWTLSRNVHLNYRAVQWADLHSLLYESLPAPNIVLWGHSYSSFEISSDKKTVVNVRARTHDDSIIQLQADLLVAADGCLSSIRKTFLPQLKLRYSGYCAWRGVVDFSNNENSETVSALRKAYPDLGKCNYFDISFQGHTILYELANQRINWVWFQNQPEPPDFNKGNSVTTKMMGRDKIEKMLESAEKVWLPEMVRVMRETREPFLNAIYDCDPLDRFSWDNVVLVGDAAHPTTPHCARGANMSILDAAVLGKCVGKHGLENLRSALEEYKSIRVHVAKEQVLFSRRTGRIKQRLDVELFDPMKASGQEERNPLHPKDIPYYDDVPYILM